MKLKNITKQAVSLSIILLTLGCFQKSHLSVTDLKCENLKEPFGINTLHPRFSWKNSSETEGAKQTAFQIVIASDMNKLSEERADFWNPGKTLSSESIFIEYDGKELSSGQLLYWKVRVWDENDQVSKWSKPAKFGVGLLNPSDWTASFIKYTEVDANANGFQSYPQFRKQFSVEQPDKKETFLLHVNSLGYHEIYLNGKKVGEDVLSPAVSQFNKRSLINTYDVTHYIKAGQNNLIIWIGSGWYTEGLPGVIGDGPLVRAQLVKISGQSIDKVVITDESWTARNSGYRRISNWRSGQFGGEEVTGNVEEQKFNYHGFRYVKISNLGKAPEIRDIKAHLIHTDFELTSTFVSSDDDLNRIHDMISYTLRNVGLGGYLVDCPHLERLGYGGDGNASTVTAQTMFNLAPLYSNWLQAWSDVIREDGGMPHTAPNPYNAGGGPFWCGFIISASWNTYQHYGDVRILKKYYPVMQQWLGYVDRYSVEGLLKKWPNTDYRNWYLGDWATPEGVGDPNHEDERSVDLVNNCYISVCLSQMEDIATVLGKEDDKKLYSEKRSQLNKKIHDTFYNVEEGYYATGSQIDIIFPMIAGVAPAELKDQLTEILIEKTEKEYDGHLNTGLVGIPVMMEWAATANEPGFVYSMLKKKTYPGYLYMLENGATTTWEHWNGERSRIHNCYNGVGQWFYQVVGGIRPVRGEKAYKKFIIQPQIPNGVTWARTSQETPYGEISVNWKLQDEKMKMNIRVPVGSTGILQYPEGTTEIKINSKTITITGNQLELESGKHTVEYLL
jgi:hypothetical protein